MQARVALSIVATIARDQLAQAAFHAAPRPAREKAKINGRFRRGAVPPRRHGAADPHTRL
jgi:hypothetical protein